MDKFVAQHLSELGPCSLPSIADEFPEHSAWISTFVLKRIFQNHIEESKAALAFVFLRRAEAAFDEWELARRTLAELAREKTASGYFKALRHLESTVAALYQSYDFARAGKAYFETRDGSSLERLNSLYNTSRHFDPSKLPPGDLHAVWITNNGLCTRANSITFEELLELLRGTGKLATAISSGKGDAETTG
jgi:hypothetical protein